MAMKIMLTAYNMGDQCDEADFDAWAKYVCEHVDEACGVEVTEVDQYPYEGGPDRDIVSGGTDEQNDSVRRWLKQEGWDAFCADASAWPQRAAS